MSEIDPNYLPRCPHGRYPDEKCHQCPRTRGNEDAGAIQRDRDRLALLVRSIAEALGCTEHENHIHGVCCLERIEKLKDTDERVAELTEALEEIAGKTCSCQSWGDPNWHSDHCSTAEARQALAGKQLRSGEMVEAKDMEGIDGK